MNFTFALLYAGYAKPESHQDYHDVCSSFSRIIHVKEGSGVLCCGNEQHKLKPGRMYLVPPLLSHSLHCTDSLEYYYVMFTDESTNLIDHFHLYRYNLEIAASKEMEMILKYFTKIAPQFSLSDLTPVSYDAPSKTMKRIKEFHNLRASVRMSINGLLHVLMSQFMDNEAPAASVNDIRISKAMWTINRDLAHVPSLDELSKNACLNKNTFIRLFHQHTGFTPTDYIIHRRILRAQQLFVSGQHSVKEVAYQVGYDNVSYFGRTFKRIVGNSPLHFIAQNKQKHITN